MRCDLRVLLVALCSVTALARDPAHVTLFCDSLQFSTGTGPGGATLDLTSDSSLNEINGELGPLNNPNLPEYGAIFRLNDPALGDIPGQIAFGKPNFEDANHDGFDDFFQSSQAVASAATPGLFQTMVGNGSVTATWSRAAGATSGSCEVHLKADAFGDLGTYTFSFQLLEYKGTFNYTPTTNSIAGTLRLTQTGTPSNTLTGVLVFARVATNRFDELTLKAGTLTNAAQQTLSYQASDIARDTTSNTNYYGFVEFADGDPSTSAIDYFEWILSIDDTNDSNHNGIPDLSDDLTANPVTGPVLGLTRSATNLLLSVQGTPGDTYLLQQVAAVTQTNWTNSTSIQLTNNLQVLALPLPGTPTRFWRLRSP